MSNFRPIDRDTGFLLPPSVDEWLPERHLARFVIEVIDSLDLRMMTGSYRGSGEASYHPGLLLGVVIYGYATGVFSSRKLERATYDSVAFRFIAANQHPDHDTIAAFRRRFLKQIETLFVQVLGVAREMGVLKLGTVALDGTKIHANASRHSALSHEHAGKIEAQLRAEVAALMAKAEAADQADVADGMSVPEELARREQRLAAIAKAKATIEARARERHAREQAEYEAKLKARAAKTAATGRKPGGKPPGAPVAGPLPSDQVNLTDADSRIMPVAGGGFEQCYNAQAVVAAGSLLVIAAGVSQAPNDKQQLVPMLDRIADLPAAFGCPAALLADHGYFSEANVNACAAAGIDPMIAMGREAHHPSLDERFAAAPPPPDPPTPLAAMAHRLKTPQGRKLYALRKQTPEPVFGIIGLANDSRPPVQYRQDHILLLRIQRHHHARHAEIAVTVDLVHILGGAKIGDLDLGRVAPGLGGHLLEAGEALLDRSASGDRNPALAIAQRAARTLGEGAADDDRRVRLLHRLGPGHNRVEVDELAVVFGLGFRPDLLHRLDALAHQLGAALEGGAVVLHLLGIPADADAEQEAALRHLVYRGHLLGGLDRIALVDQAYPGADFQLRGGRRGGGEGHKGVHAVVVALRQVAAAGEGGAARGGDM